MHSNGVVLYEGPSEINGEPIVAIATGVREPSANKKTGPMVQVTILARDISPTEALRTGEDEAICSDCTKRPKVSGGDGRCYVSVHRAPLSIWRTYKRGGYVELTPERAAWLRLQSIRFGAYGDPGAVPEHVWKRVRNSRGQHTGYTGQWRRAPAMRKWLMASCHTEEEAIEAESLGWRVFAVVQRDEDHIGDLPGWTWCPSDPARESTGPTLTCMQCQRCSGTEFGKSNVFIYEHGSMYPRKTLPIFP